MLLAARTGRRFTTRVSGPLGDPVDADWGLLDDGTAVIEMARASGLALVATNDPLRADTRGTGELLQAAIADGAEQAIVTLGGSAGTDGGLGAVEVLDWRLPIPVTVRVRCRDALRRRRSGLRPTEGAAAQDIETLEQRLHALEKRYGVADLPGAGAAGRPCGRARGARRHAAFRF